MEILQGPKAHYKVPEDHAAPLKRQVLQDHKAALMERSPRYFGPHGRQLFKSDHGFDYPHPVTPYEEALHKFQLKQRTVRESALKSALKKGV